MDTGRVLWYHDNMSNKTLRTVKVGRTGSALSVCLPAAVCREFEIARGDTLVLSTPRRGVLQLRAITPEEVEKIIRY